MEEEDQKKSVVSKLKHVRGVRDEAKVKANIKKWKGAVNKIKAVNALKAGTLAAAQRANA